jgi:predicted GH43/DUF377 family glycosyl hydrolase
MDTAPLAAPATESPAWGLGPFTKLHARNPVMVPDPAQRFRCPFAGEVAWEAKDVFNPAAVVRDGRVHLLYRAEDLVGRHKGTSRIGLAVSGDGTSFVREPAPVLFPARDGHEGLEWEGGCEDPRCVQGEDGTYVMTYTAYDGKIARLFVASSRDLRTWTKHGSAFAPRFRDTWSKSGSIVCRRVGDALVAQRINGVYWMYFGESDIFAATSDDLLRWTPVEGIDRGRPHQEIAGDPRRYLRPVFSTRAGRFDSGLVEPGPPAVLTERGIVFLYNCANAGKSGGDKRLPDWTYAPGQVLLDACDPTVVIARCQAPFLIPDQEYERTGQIANVCFIEGLVPFQGKWWLYYGTADSRIAVATAPLLG